MEEILVLLGRQVNRKEYIKVLVSKSDHRSRNTNQSCVQRSRNPSNFQEVYCLLSFKTRNTKFPLFYDCTNENIFRLFDHRPQRK